MMMMNQEEDVGVINEDITIKDEDNEDDNEEDNDEEDDEEDDKKHDEEMKMIMKKNEKDINSLKKEFKVYLIIILLLCSIIKKEVMI